MGLSGRALAEAFVRVRADMSAVGPDVAKGTQQAVDGASKSASRGLKAAITTPFREGFADAAKAADPGGQAVGGRLRQGLVGKLRGVTADTTKAGQDAGTGLATGMASKTRGIAAQTAAAGRTAGTGFAREAGKGIERDGSFIGRAAKSTAGQVLGAFGAAQIGMGAIHLFAGMISDARESAKVTALTEQVIRTTGGAAHITAGQVGELATSISNKTGVDDEAIQSGSNLLLTFTGVRNEVGAGNDIFNQATSIMTDMSVALGTDASGAAIQLGKALNDPIKGVSALQRVGVSFTASQKAQIKSLVDSGHAMEAQKIILAELGREFGGAAAAAATPMDRLRVTLGNLGEQVGTALLPVIDRLATIMVEDVVPGVSAAVSWFTKVPAPVYAAAAGAVALYTAFRVGRGVLAGVATITQNVGTAMQWMGLRTAEATTAQGLQTAASGRQAAAANVATASTTRLGAAMGFLAKAGGIVALAAVANQLTEMGSQMVGAKASTGALDQAMLQLGRDGTLSSAALIPFKQGWGPFSQDVHTSGEAMRTFGDLAKGALGGAGESMLDWIGRMQSGSSRMGQLKNITDQYDASLAHLASGGNTAAAKAAFDQLMSAARAQGVSVEDLKGMFPQYSAAVAAAGAANAGAAPPTAALSAAQKDAAGAAARQKQNLDALTSTLTASTNATLLARGGETAYFAALGAVSGAVTANGRTLDVHSEKGRANRGVMDALASASLSYLGTIQKNNGVGPLFRRTLDQQWQKLFEAARRFGATREDARKYANQILATPKALATKVSTPGMSAAQAAVKALHQDINNLSNRSIKITVNSDGTFTQGTRKGRAAGGPIDGYSPTPTADNIPIDATAGEHMWSVAEVRGAGGHAQVERYRQAARAGALPRLGLAAGGPVTNRTITVKGSAALPSASTLNSVIDADMLAAYKTAAAAASAANAASGGGGGPAGAGVQRWASMVQQALGVLGLSTSAAMVQRVLRQIQTESGGNPRAIQGNIGDVNNRSGDLAQGLMQVIGATFRAYHVIGSSWNRLDPWASILAGLNYAKHRYGPSLSFLGQGHGYAAGTSSAAPGWAWTGENGPELVRFRGGEQVMSAGASAAAAAGGGGGPVRLHPDTVAQLGAVIGAAVAGQAVLLDGQAIAGYVGRSFGRSSLSMRG